MLNILLVDDEKLCLESLKMVVSKVLPDAQCTTFRKASEALAYIAEHDVDMAFLDINMRGISGITIANELRVKNPRMNIFFCTGYEEYALAAWELNSSGYLLKPITEEKVRNAIENMRYPIEDRPRVELRCFGNFEVYCDGVPIVFKYKRTKEMLAYLVDRNGASCSIAEIESALFENSDHRSYLNQMRLDLLNTLEDLGVQDILIKNHGHLAIARDNVKCDYFDYLDHKTDVKVFEYMSLYSFAENTLGWLTARQ